MYWKDIGLHGLASTSLLIRRGSMLHVSHALRLQQEIGNPLPKLIFLGRTQATLALQSEARSGYRTGTVTNRWLLGNMFLLCQGFRGKKIHLFLTHAFCTTRKFRIWGDDGKCRKKCLVERRLVVRMQ